MESGRIKQHARPESVSPPVSPPHELPFAESSPPHSAGEHISISPLDGSPGKSPPCSSGSSDGSPIDHVLSSECVQYRDIQSPVVAVNRTVSEEPPVIVVKKIDQDGGDGDGSVPRGARRSSSILRSAKRRKMVQNAALGFRIFGLMFCLVSFSVMAADRSQGWALDSFDRYKEFRFCISANIIGFLYSGIQAIHLSYSLAIGKYALQHKKKLRYYLNFAFDQIIAYLLLSAASSATVRIDDWRSNWGKDKFPDMAGAAVSMAYLAFVALASSSLISGYALCTYTSL